MKLHLVSHRDVENGDGESEFYMTNIFCSTSIHYLRLDLVVCIVYRSSLFIFTLSLFLMSSICTTCGIEGSCQHSRVDDKPMSVTDFLDFVGTQNARAYCSMCQLPYTETLSANDSLNFCDACWHYTNSISARNVIGGEGTIEDPVIIADPMQPIGEEEGDDDDYLVCRECGCLGDRYDVDTDSWLCIECDDYRAGFRVH